jgi:hypothetical protein
MKEGILTEAQRCLTIKDGFSSRKITDLISLSKNHDADELIMFLCDLYFEKHRLVSALLERDDNSIMLDMGIGAMFRLTQAIKILKDSRKEKDIDQFESRTAASG